MAPLLERPWSFVYLYILGLALGHVSYIRIKSYSGPISLYVSTKIVKLCFVLYVFDCYISLSPLPCAKG